MVDRDNLFGTLHPDTFRVFSGRLRWLYAELLEYLAVSLFDEGSIMPRSEVMETIRAFVERANYNCDEGDEAEGDAEFLGAADTGAKAQVLYSRLVATGWLVEHRDVYRRLVDLDANARLVLDLLLDLKAGRLRSYGGEVLQVLALLEAARADAANRSEAVRNAARSARSFLNHLRSVGSAMRKAEQAVVAQRELAAFIRQVFSDFIAKHLVEDFQRLHTRANPFRFRVRILELASEMESDELLLDQLADAYVNEGRAGDRAQGRDVVVGELRLVQRVFQDLNIYIDAIDDTQSRVEKRLRNTVRHMDRIADAKTALITEVFRDLAAAPLADDGNTPMAARAVPGGLPQGEANMFQAAARRQKPGAKPIQRRKMDPAMLAYKQAVDAYNARSMVTPGIVDAYLRRHIGAEQAVNGAALPLACLDDFFVFERLRSLPFLEGGALAGKYRVELEPGEIDNDWITCGNFTVVRLPEEKRDGE